MKGGVFKVIKIFSASIGKNFIQIMIALLLTPLLVKNLGAEVFGASKVILDIFGHLSLIEFGLFGGLIAALSGPISRGENREIVKIVCWGRRTYFRLGLIIALLNIGLIPLYLFVLKLSSAHRFDIICSVFLLSLSPLFYSAQADRALLESKHEGHKTQLSMLIQSLLVSFLAYILAIYYPSIFSQIFALVSGTILFSLILKRLTHIKVDSSIKEEINLGREEFSKLGKLQRHQFLNDLSGQICLFADNIMISLMMGAAPVTIFFITQRTAVIFQGQLQNFSNSIWPLLSYRVNMGDREGFSLYLNTSVKLLGGIGAPSLLVIALLNESFLKLWMPTGGYGGDLMTYFACLNAYLLALLGLWGWVFTAAEKVWVMTPMMLTQAGVNFTVGILATKYIGLAGPIIGTSVGLFCISLPWLLVSLKQHFCVSIRAIIFSIIKPFIFPLLMGMVGLWAKKNQYFFRPDSVWELIFQGGLAITLLLPLNLLFISGHLEKKLLLSLVAKIKARFAAT